MPCQSHYPSPAEMRERESIDREWKRELDLITAKLCFACSVLQANNLLNGELFSWYENHKKQDSDRIEKEKQASDAAAEKESRRKYLKSIKERLVKQLTADELASLEVDGSAIG